MSLEHRITTAELAKKEEPNGLCVVRMGLSVQLDPYEARRMLKEWKYETLGELLWPFIGRCKK